MATDPLAAVEAGHRRLSEQVRTLTADVNTLNRAVAALGRAQQPDEREPLIPTLVEHPDAAVIDLLDWLAVVYLRYRGSTLAPCWAWHPEVVEELSWLRGLHQAVCASRIVRDLGDWHDRYRPGVVRRVSDYLAGCHIEKHLDPPAEVTVPLGEALGPIAAARADNTPIPAPSHAQIATARTLTTRARTNGTTPAPSTT